MLVLLDLICVEHLNFGGVIGSLLWVSLLLTLSHIYALLLPCFVQIIMLNLCLIAKVISFIPYNKEKNENIFKYRTHEYNVWAK